MRVGPPANMDMASVAMKHGSPSFEQRRCPTVPPVKHVQVWFILRSCVMKGYNVMKLSRELAREKQRAETRERAEPSRLDPGRRRGAKQE